MASVAAASVGPVLPADTSASARPSATAAAAWTIEASGFERTARTGFLVADDRTGASTTIAVARERGRRGRNQQWARRTGARPRRPPPAPPSAPFASTAITGSLRATRRRSRRPRCGRSRGRRRCRTRRTRGAGCGERRSAGRPRCSAPRSCAGSAACWCAREDCRCLGTAMSDGQRLAPVSVELRALRAWPSAGRAPARARARGLRFRFSPHLAHRPAQSSRQRIWVGSASASASRAQARRSSSWSVQVGRAQLVAAAGLVDLARVHLDHGVRVLQAAHARRRRGGPRSAAAARTRRPWCATRPGGR